MASTKSRGPARKTGRRGPKSAGAPATKDAPRGEAAKGGARSGAPRVVEGEAREPAARKKSVSPLAFLQQVRAEASKVVWTGRNETFISTLMVLFMVALMGLFFFLVDWLLRAGVCALLPGNCAANF